MADAPSLPQQLKQYLDALRAAGVDFVPKAGPAPFVKAAPKAVVSAEPVDPIADRRRGLKLLADEIEDCAKCLELFSTRSQTIFGTGPIGAAVAFLGDGPDSVDDREGKPFVGESAAWLTRALGALGLNRDEVYLLNATRCRAPGKRFPSTRECANCRDYLVRELALAQPKAICCLGTQVAQTLLATAKSIAELRGAVHDYAGTPVVCTFHPAYVLKNPKSEPDGRADLGLLAKVLGLAESE